MHPTLIAQAIWANEIGSRYDEKVCSELCDENVCLGQSCVSSHTFAKQLQALEQDRASRRRGDTAPAGARGSRRHQK